MTYISSSIGSHGHSLLLLLTAPWCGECATVDRQVRSAAAQLTLLHRAARLALVNVATSGGAAVSDALIEQPMARRLRQCVVPSWSVVLTLTYYG